MKDLGWAILRLLVIALTALLMLPFRILGFIVGIIKEPFKLGMKSATLFWMKYLQWVHNIKPDAGT